ncbi:MAG: AraC family transcriptional regulator [Bryobacterales bacterium]|nr:AraC family transcriptional regulator [Bryobacterales bacterium]
MPIAYRETGPSECLQQHVECIWTSHASAAAVHRVYPDGCADILYSRTAEHSSLRVIGPMTRFADVPSEAGIMVIAARFRPGMLSLWSGPPCGEMTDQAIEFAALTGFAARRWKQRLDDIPSNSLKPEVLENVWREMLGPLPPPNPAQRAILHLERNHGNVDLEWLAAQANLSDRQFRRVCQRFTGLAPKQLARTLRFRRALGMVRTAARGELTGIAVDCGYYDQAHFIHDLRAFAGRNPTEFLK